MAFLWYKHSQWKLLFVNKNAARASVLWSPCVFAPSGLRVSLALTDTGRAIVAVTTVFERLGFHQKLLCHRGAGERSKRQVCSWPPSWLAKTVCVRGPGLCPCFPRTSRWWILSHLAGESAPSASWVCLVLLPQSLELQGLLLHLHFPLAC